MMNRRSILVTAVTTLVAIALLTACVAVAIADDPQPVGNHSIRPPVAGDAAPATDPGFRLVASTWGAAGSRASSTGFRLYGTMGQPSMIGHSSTADLALWSGYWAQIAQPVAYNRPPSNGTVIPSSGSGPDGVTTYFETTWSDPDGWRDLKHGYFHIGEDSSLVDNVTLMYNVQSKKLWIRSDDGSTWWGGFAPWSDNVLENRQAKVYCLLTRDDRSADTVSIRWAIKFKALSVGPKKTGLKCTDLHKARAKGAWKGTWNVY
jgi:hypothetical protein